MADRGGMDVNEESLPRATVVKVIKDIIAAKGLEVQATKESIDLLCMASVEFIKLISQEANTVCERDKRKTIAPEHVVQAMKDLEWTKHAPVLEATMLAEREEARAIAQKAKASRATDMTEEELLAEQEKLFAASRKRFEAGQ